MESSSNICFTCSKHASKPDPELAKKPVDYFIGKYVKVSFNEINTNNIEHVWVLVSSAKNPTTLIGTIDNDPILNIGLKCGDTVDVTLDQIEKVYVE